MSKDRNRSPFNLNEEIVDNILNTNNNFVSTLDHLPCDITRSLWLIQTLGLKNNRLKEQLHGILIDERHDELQIRRIQELIERNLREAQQEAKYLVLVLNNHLDTLADDCEILKELKSKLDGWTSEAVEKRWIEWNDFKRAYLEKNSRKQINGSTSKTFKYDYDYGNDYDYDTKMLANENGKPDAKTGSENIVNKKNISVSTGSKFVSVSSSTSNGKLKIKLTLKPTGSPDLTTRNRKSSTPSATTNSNNTKRKTSVEVLPNKKVKKEPKNGNLKGTKKEKMRKDIDIENTENRNLEEKAKLTIEPQTGVLTIPPQPIEKYCFCNGPSFGRMVACENERCPHEWFHFKCVGLFKEPEGAWFCSKKCEEQHISFKVSIKKKKKKRRGW